jgi:hypothetical protein
MVKRYVSHMGAIIPIAEEDAELEWKNFKKFVASEDYSALETELKAMTQSRNDWRDIAKRAELKHGD